jgi:hypothetical protein
MALAGGMVPAPDTIAVSVSSLQEAVMALLGGMLLVCQEQGS